MPKTSTWILRTAIHVIFPSWMSRSSSRATASRKQYLAVFGCDQSMALAIENRMS
jgi:hypothetical protein